MKEQEWRVRAASVLRRTVALLQGGRSTRLKKQQRHQQEAQGGAMNAN